VAHLDAAYNLARYLMRNETEAEDVVQSAYVRAICHFAGFRGGDGRAWLLTIVRNSCYDRMRKMGSSLQDMDFDEAVHSGERQNPNPETVALLSERAELVRKSLAELPAESREVIVYGSWINCHTGRSRALWESPSVLSCHVLAVLANGFTKLCLVAWNEEKLTRCPDRTCVDV